jgi:hypothetical protein
MDVRRPLLGFVVLVIGWATPVSAHVLLEEPLRRYDDMKGGPCGRGDGEDGRTSHFARYQPGETITVRWTETIDHVGSFWVAFDDDGADQVDFDANVLHTESDPRNESGQAWQAEVILPDVDCNNCTLQLRQVMTTSENPSPNEIYFQCADLVLGDETSAPAAPGGAGCHTTSSFPTALVLLASLWGNRRSFRAGR